MRRLIQRKSASNGAMAKSSHAIYRVEDCIKAMQSGTDIVKVKSHRHYQKRYFLDADASYLFWQPTNKPKEEARIPIATIKEVRRGQNTESFCSNGKGFDEGKSFSVIHGDEYKSLDVVAASEEEANIWMSGLGCLMDGNYGTQATERKQQIRDRWLSKTFEEADKDGSGSLDESELIALTQKLNIGLPANKIKQKFKQYDTDHGEDSSGKLDIGEFAALFKELSTRPEVHHLLMRYSASREFLRPEELKAFLETDQGEENVTVDFCKQMIATYEPSPEGRENQMLSIDGFTQFLLGEQASILNHCHRPKFQDMTQPMAHYYIASSHNTYLMEDQLRGPSSVEMYVRALRRGCRCVELDCWDGDNEPEIYHGHTLTSHILFQDVIKAVKEHAFATSEYPVILSLENHCSMPMQRKMADFLKTILGDTLWIPPPEEIAGASHLPSPESLKGKVLIKGKKLKPEAEAGTDEDDGGDVSDEDEAAEMEPADKGKENGAGGPGDDSTLGKKKKQASAKKIKLAKTLSRLVTNHAVHFASFETSLQSGKGYQMSSFGESKTMKLASSSSHQFVNYNKRQLSRIYPAGSRVTSSNYNPQMAWNVGCQIVALNYQTSGESMDLNIGRFQINGKTGYVLKPQPLRSEISTVDITTKSIIPGITPNLLKVKIISGQTLPKPPGSSDKGEVIDPYVVVDIHGIPHDENHKQTKTISDNGFNPVWDKMFPFLLKFPDVAMIRFSVVDDDPLGDDFIGQFSLPVSSMKTGYRHVPLFSKSGEQLPGCSIFVHIAKERAYTLKKSSLSRIMSFSGGSTDKPRKMGCVSLDELFQSISRDSVESTRLRQATEKSTEHFKRKVGFSGSATLKQAFSVFATKMKAASIEFYLEKHEDFLLLRHSSGIPKPSMKMVASFEEMLHSFEALVNNCPAITKKLMDVYGAGEKKFPDELSQSDVKGAKLEKSRETFAWNMQMIKSQADLLTAAKDSILYSVRQLEDSASSSGIDVKFEF